MPTSEAAATTPRLPLSRDRVLATAIEIADAGGIEAISMRKLAHELGVEAMSLYNHVANKPDLLDAITDRAVAEIWVPAPGDPWKPAMRRRAISVREMLQRHPWALGLIDSSPNPSLDRLHYTESVLACLRGGGFSVRGAVHAFFSLDSYIYGFALQERSLPLGNPEDIVSVGEQILQRLPADEYASLREVIVEFMDAAFTYAEEFEFGLDLLLDALERTRGADR